MPRMRMKRCLLCGVLPALAAALLPACAPPMIIASAGFKAFEAGTAAYVDRQLEAAFAEPIDRALEAVRSALSELDFEITHERPQEHSMTLRSKERGGRKIVVTLYEKSDIVTKITIQVGMLGDQSISRLILVKIEAELAELRIAPEPPSGVPPETP